MLLDLSCQKVGSVYQHWWDNCSDQVKESKDYCEESVIAYRRHFVLIVFDAQGASMNGVEPQACLRDQRLPNMCQTLAENGVGLATLPSNVSNVQYDLAAVVLCLGDHRNQIGHQTCWWIIPEWNLCPVEHARCLFHVLQIVFPLFVNCVGW